MELLIIGIIVAANIVIIKMKFDRKRYEDAILDSVLLITVTTIFMGSFPGLVVATVASMLISLFLLASPPKSLNIKLPNNTTLDPIGILEEFKRRAERRYV